MHDALLNGRQNIDERETARNDKQSDRDNRQPTELGDNCTANLEHRQTFIAPNASRK
jgi:hypothetical protein